MIDEVKRNPTPTPANDEEYEDREMNYEVERQAHLRHSGEDLIWCTSMQRQEYNLNQCRRQLDVRETHLYVRECRCDHREAEIRATRIGGYGYGKREWIRVEVCIIYFNKNNMLGLVRTLLG
jgi:hypothetical protein